MRYERPAVERTALLGEMLSKLSICREYPLKCEDR